MSKLLAAGMPEADIFCAVTSRPAEILGLSDQAGGLRPGAPAALTLLTFRAAAPPLAAGHRTARPGGCFEPVLTLLDGVRFAPEDTASN